MTVLLSPDMTPEQFRGWYARLKAIDPKLTHEKLAKRLDVDQPRIGKWMRSKEDGGIARSGYLHLALERLEQIMIAEQAAAVEAERKPKRRRHATPEATSDA